MEGGRIGHALFFSSNFVAWGQDQADRQPSSVPNPASCRVPPGSTWTFSEPWMEDESAQPLRRDVLVKNLVGLDLKVYRDVKI